MSAIYVISYIPGMYGEFFCNLISSDDNYYDPSHTSEFTADNRHGFRSVVEDLYSFVGWGWPVASNEVRQHILENYSEKNIVMRTHNYKEYIDVNLANLKQVKFHDDEWLYPVLLFFTKAIKTRASTHPQFLQKEWMIPFFEEYSKIPEVTDSLIENVDDVTWMEIDMAILGLPTIKDYIKFKLDLYEREAPIKSGNGNWQYANPYKLLSNPESHVDKWKELFDMAKPFDINTLKQYKEGNDKIIKDTFGKDYNEIKNSDYVDMLHKHCQQYLLVFKE
jgi:hypothetical protein